MSGERKHYRSRSKPSFFDKPDGYYDIKPKLERKPAVKKDLDKFFEAQGIDVPGKLPSEIYQAILRLNGDKIPDDTIKRELKQGKR